tara:strand:- start:349 stop:753 length:405 start_codon:yes stop_codon:yes gene_type:complete
MNNENKIEIMLNTTNTACLTHTDSSANFIAGAGYNYTGDLNYSNKSSITMIGHSDTYNNLTIKNNNDHMNTQAKIAIFEVTRDEKGNINSSKFKVEFWMEKKKGASMELAAAKYLSKDFDPDLIVVKELYSATF